MRPGSFWSQVGKAGLVRVLLVYIGASWLILEATDVFIDNFGLPEWFFPAAILLLLIGLVIVSATAWVQSAAVAKAKGAETPRAWEIDLRGLLGSLANRRLPHLTWARAIGGGVVAFSLLFGVAGVYVLLRERGAAIPAVKEAVAAAAPGIAVLPFRVSGQGLDVWREGMLDLLSTNLDGVAGLRTIDSRTVMARWREQVEGIGSPDLETALEVARRTGARYALVGNAVLIGPEVRLVADIYEIESKANLGRGQVQGPPDSVLILVDRLCIEVLRAILPGEQGELPRVSLAHVTTTSLPALKSYLEGEVFFRRSDFEAAIRAYTRAMEADSTFALAFYRLAEAHGWTETIASEKVARYTERAAWLADRLPERQALLVRARLALQRGTLEGIEILREAVRKYPDDAEAWYLLGDTYFHLGSQALIGPEESERAFRRAVELDPGFTPAYIHLVQIAFNHYVDGERASKLIETYGRLARGSEYDLRNRLAFALAFGDSARRSQARASLDTLQPHSLEVVFLTLLHPRFRTAQREVLTVLRRRPETPEGARATINLFVNNVQLGKLQEAHESLNDPFMPDWFRGLGLYTLYLKGMPVAPKRLEAELALGAADSLPELKSFYGGAYAADRGKWADHRAALGRLRGYAQHFGTEGDSTSARFYEGAALALEGYALWRQDRKEGAVRVLETARRQATGYEIRFGVNGTIRLWLWKLLLELGRPQAAQRYFDFFGQDFLRPYSVA